MFIFLPAKKRYFLAYLGSSKSFLSLCNHQKWFDERYIIEFLFTYLSIMTFSNFAISLYENIEHFRILDSDIAQNIINLRNLLHTVKKTIKNNPP